MTLVTGTRLPGVLVPIVRECKCRVFGSEEVVVAVAAEPSEAFAAAGVAAVRALWVCVSRFGLMRRC